MIHARNFLPIRLLAYSFINGIIAIARYGKEYGCYEWQMIDESMGKRRRKSKLEVVQHRAWKFYQTWRQAGSFSPALQEKIFVTRLGWDHLLSPRKRRTKREKIVRLNALPLARKLLETSTTYQEHRVDKERGISYWAFVAAMDGKRIKVVVSARRLKKYFLSVIVMR